jgi:hypothetical protein
MPESKRQLLSERTVSRQSGKASGDRSDKGGKEAAALPFGLTLKLDEEPAQGLGVEVGLGTVWGVADCRLRVG